MTALEKDVVDVENSVFFSKATSTVDHWALGVWYATACRSKYLIKPKLIFFLFCASNSYTGRESDTLRTANSVQTWVLHVCVNKNIAMQNVIN